MFVFVVLFCLFLAAFWSPAGNVSLVCCVFLHFCHFPILSWSTSERRVRLVPLHMFKPSDRSKAVLLLWILFVDSFVFIILCCLFLAALWSPAGKWLPTSWLSCVWCFLVLSLSHMVTLWLYRFLIFAFFTFILFLIPSCVWLGFIVFHSHSVVTYSFYGFTSQSTAMVMLRQLI